jgi:probable O-glycosylation ligase (exosortase A-associated)
MRDLIMLVAMAVLVPMAVSNVFGAFLLWEWTAVLSPTYYLFGFMQSVRYNLIFAVVTLGLLFLGRLTNRGQFRFTGMMAFMILFLIHSCLSAAFSFNNPLNQDIWFDLMKSLIYCLLIPMFVSSRLRLHAMLIMVALGLGFHGAVEGLKVVQTAGAHHPTGIQTSKMSDNNHFAVAMVMVVPLLFYLFRYAERRLVKIGFLGVFALTVMAIVGTQSRGGFVALAITGLFLILSSRHKLRGLIVVAVMGGIIVGTAPASFFERMQTIETAEKDDSFLGRVAAWRISTAMALDNPMLGGGMHSVQVQPVWERYKAAAERFTFLPRVGDMPDVYKAAHSIYFEILGDQGFLGLAIFLALFAFAFLNILAVRRTAARFHGELIWASDMATALGVSLLAFSVGGALVSLAYFETFYVLLMLTEALKHIVNAKAKELEQGGHLRNRPQKPIPAQGVSAPGYGARSM